MGFCSSLTLIFIVLKLTAYVDWSWWVVISPLLIEIVIGFLLFAYATREQAKINVRKRV